jgi:hypothetical protein
LLFDIPERETSFNKFQIPDYTLACTTLRQMKNSSHGLITNGSDG